MDIMDAARNVAEDHRGGCKALAERIGKNHTTLAHELSEIGTAKLGLRTALKISKFTSDTRILNAFAEEMGCMVLPLPSALAVDGDDAMRLVSTLACEFNDVVQSFVQAMADGRVTENEVDALTRQWGELQRAGQRLVAHAATLHELGKPSHLRGA